MIEVLAYIFLKVWLTVLAIIAGVVAYKTVREVFEDGEFLMTALVLFIEVPMVLIMVALLFDIWTS